MQEEENLKQASFEEKESFEEGEVYQITSPSSSSLPSLTPFVVVALFLAGVLGILWWASPADQKDKSVYICHSTQTESGQGFCFR
ncbi:hypothetical protein [Acetobacter thailandicus]|uniref:Uncharacterized protein n=1 Tax=Acetobacter thailandicus TaxID=1502842 RepID=A0ABT3QGW5_9PROT|nr:hypothetical protein [Acetobacter thailandicus]MCX2564518.1 hypothetical protein [Acetobacter thailandicus]NHN96108.1 hypothetical protein [Acetobacter thailandicus]